MNRRLCSAITIVFALVAVLPQARAQDATTPQPKHRYLADASALSAGETITGPSRVLDLKGRKGINPQSIRAAIDGKILLEIDDISRTNTGGILNYGPIALRCMVHTSMVFRNLKVYTERLPFSEVKAKQ